MHAPFGNRNALLASQTEQKLIEHVQLAEEHFLAQLSRHGRNEVAGCSGCHAPRSPSTESDYGNSPAQQRDTSAFEPSPSTVREDQKGPVVSAVRRLGMVRVTEVNNTTDTVIDYVCNGHECRIMWKRQPMVRRPETVGLNWHIPNTHCWYCGSRLWERKTVIEKRVSLRDLEYEESIRGMMTRETIVRTEAADAQPGDVAIYPES